MVTLVLYRLGLRCFGVAWCLCLVGGCIYISRDSSISSEAMGAEAIGHVREVLGSGELEEEHGWDPRK